MIRQLKKNTLWITLSALLPLFGGASAAHADGCSGAFVLANGNNVSIHYQIKWGDGDWKSYCVYPNRRKWHSIELDEDGGVPTPRIRFDWIAGDGKTTYRTYKLDVYAVHNPANGKNYRFRFSRCGCYLDLKRE